MVSCWSYNFCFACVSLFIWQLWLGKSLKQQKLLLYQRTNVFFDYLFAFLFFSSIRQHTCYISGRFFFQAEDGIRDDCCWLSKLDAADEADEIDDMGEAGLMLDVGESVCNVL